MTTKPPHEWRCKPLGEIADVGAGSSAPQGKGAFEDGTCPFIRTSDVGQIRFGEISTANDLLNDEAAKKLRLVPAGAILMPKSGASTFLNHRVQMTIDGYVSSHLATIVAYKTEALPRYLLYYLLTVKAQNLIQDHKYPSLTLKLIKSIPVHLPPLDEQKRIVAVLDQAFAALDRARAHTESNLINAEELVDQAREQLLSRNQSGWTEESLADLITVKHGFAFKSKFFENKGKYVLLTPGNFFERGGFRHRGEKQKYYRGEIPTGFILNEGDLLMAMTEQAPGLLGSCILVPENDRFLHNQRLGLIQPKNPENWHSPYFAHVFNLRAFRKVLSDTCTGIKVRHTSPDKIRSTTVPVPPNVGTQKSVAHQIDQIAAASENLTKSYSAKLEQIETLRKSLLHQAFSGYLT